MSIAYFITSDAPIPAVRHDTWHIWHPEVILELATGKPYGARLEWDAYSSESAAEIRAYLEACLRDNDTLELWRVWQDGDLDHPVKKKSISIAALSIEDLQKFASLAVWQEPIVDHLLLLTKN